MRGSGEQVLLAEAKALRQHKGRLEARMEILEDHNLQLESQLQRLRRLLESDPETSSLNLSPAVPSSRAQTNGRAGAVVNGNGYHFPSEGKRSRQ